MNRRRNLLGGVAALAAAPVPVLAMAVPSPDAEVIRLAQGVIKAEAAYQAAYEIPNLTVEEEQALEPQRQLLMDAASDQAEALAPLPVVTLAGVLAKARAALAVADRSSVDGEIVVKDYVEWLAYAALEDLVQVAGGEA